MQIFQQNTPVPPPRRKRLAKLKTKLPEDENSGPHLKFPTQTARGSPERSTSPTPAPRSYTGASEELDAIKTRNESGNELNLPGGSSRSRTGSHGSTDSAPKSDHQMVPRPAPAVPSGGEDFKQEPWFLGMISRSKSEALLLQNGNPADFLIRESTNRVRKYSEFTKFWHCL